MMHTNAMVKLNQQESQKLMQRMYTDPSFAQQLKSVLATKNEAQTANFLKSKGFKLS